MLIHVGNNDFVDLNLCIAIINLSTVDLETKERIIKSVSGIEPSEIRAAVLTANGKWLGSALSADALVQRGNNHRFSGAYYVNPLYDRPGSTLNSKDTDDRVPREPERVEAARDVSGEKQNVRIR